MAKTNGKANDKGSTSKAMADLEKAKKLFADANKKYQDKRAAVTKAKRTVATGDKKLATLEKKIAETKDAPSKAAEILKKKAEEMIRKAAEMDAQQEEVLAKAAEMEGKITAKEEEFKTAKEKADSELEAMGVSTKTTRAASSGTTAERRAKNNFQYRLKSKGWDLNYNVKGRIESAEKYGLMVVFDQEEFVMSKGGAEVLRHPYGEGSLSSLATSVKEHGEGVEAD